MRTILFTTLLLAATLLAACGGGDNASPTSTPTPVASPTATPSPTATYNPTPTGSIDATNVCGVNPSPAKPTEVVVDAPGPGGRVTSPVTVAGKIAAFEATFQISIKDSGGNDIATQQGHSAEGQTLSAFTQAVPFSVSRELPACIWVFQYSAKDGSPITVHQIPVFLEPSSSSDVCTTNPDPATQDQTQVSSPAAGDHVTSPLQVTGLINAFEAQFNIAIKDAGGNDIANVPDVFSSQGQTLAPFSTAVPFTVATQTPACLWVFDISQMSGQPIQVVQVPIVLEP